MATTNMPTGGSPDNPTIGNLIAAYEAASAAFSAIAAAAPADEQRPEYRDAARRYHAASHAVRDARPTDPLDLAAQLRWLLTPDQEDLWQEPLGEILQNVADRLAEIATDGTGSLDGALEAAAANVCNGVLHIDRCVLQDPGQDASWGEVNRYSNGLLWLVEHLVADTRELAVACWGKELGAELFAPAGDRS